MTANRRVRMLPMPAKRKDQEPEQLPSMIVKEDPVSRATLIVNVTAGAGLLAMLAGMLWSYAQLGPGAW